MAVRVTVPAAGTMAMPRPVPATGLVTVPGARSRPVLVPGPGTTAAAVPGAVPAGRLRRGVRGLMRRGHRPIIARTTGALCSARPN